MDLDNDIQLQKFIDEAKLNNGVVNKAHILPLYVSQSRKMTKLKKEFEHFEKLIEDHNKLIWNHESIIREWLTMNVYTTKNELFKSDIEAIIRSFLDEFSRTVNEELKLKANEIDFVNKMRQKASANDVGKLYLDVAEMKKKLDELSDKQIGSFTLS